MSQGWSLNNIEKTFESQDRICIASRLKQVHTDGALCPHELDPYAQADFKAILVGLADELGTSKLCCHCHEELYHLHAQKDNTTKKLYHWFVCKRWASSESEWTALITRDLNPGINVWNLAHQWNLFQTCYTVLSNSGGLASISAGNAIEERAGASVDITVGQAANNQTDTMQLGTCNVRGWKGVKGIHERLNMRWMKHMPDFLERN